MLQIDLADRESRTSVLKLGGAHAFAYADLVMFSIAWTQPQHTYRLMHITPQYASPGQPIIAVQQCLSASLSRLNEC